MILDSTTILASVSIIVSIISIVISFKKYQKYQSSLERIKTHNAFYGFHLANRISIDFPETLQAVHGIKEDNDECRNIAYLSVLMDIFQETHTNNGQTTFLDKITSIPENKKRWEIMKNIYYGEFDKEFIKMIDEKFEKNSKKPISKNLMR